MMIGPAVISPVPTSDPYYPIGCPPGYKRRPGFRCVRQDLAGFGADDAKTNWVLLGAGAVGVVGMLVWWFSKPAMKANKRRRYVTVQTVCGPRHLALPKLRRRKKRSR